jgi:sigma-B regulation protein RsbU (phosphoserine phosphatase)
METATITPSPHMPITSPDYVRLLHEAQKQLEHLRLLQRISADFTVSLDLDQVLRTCLERIQFVMESQGASLLMIEGNELVFKVAIGYKADEVKPFRVPLGEGIAGWVARHARGTIANDVHRDARFYEGVDKGSGFVTQSLVAAPLMVNERVIGVVEVTNKAEGFSDDDLNLLMTIAPLAAMAIENARLYQLAVDRGRMERELQMARDVQSSLVPRVTAYLQGWEFAAQWQPAEAVSGDFYDFIPIEFVKVGKPTQTPKGELGLVIADASGHGMPAALFMTLTRSVVRASVTQARPITECIAQANRLICADATDGMFVTLLYAQLAPNNGQVVYVNAGHPAPLWYRAGTGELAELPSNDIPLGLEETRQFELHTIELEKGDFVIFCTDGVTEATNLAGDEFGKYHLRRVILEHTQHPPEPLLLAIQQAVREFAGAARQEDDMTLLVVKRV